VIESRSTKCVPTDAVSGFMVLNLISVNTSWFLPILFCKNNGLPVSIRPNKYMNMNTGSPKRSAKTEMMMSNIRSIIL